MKRTLSSGLYLNAKKTPSVQRVFTWFCKNKSSCKKGSRHTTVNWHKGVNLRNQFTFDMKRNEKKKTERRHWNVMNMCAHMSILTHAIDTTNLSFATFYRRFFLLTDTCPHSTQTKNLLFIFECLACSCVSFRLVRNGHIENWS